MSAESSRQSGRSPLARSGVRLKILALIVTAALVPALLVGAASYFTAQSILLEKTNERLATRTESVASDIEAWMAERRQDVEIFANSFVVTDNLARVAGGAPDRAAHIREYLQQVHERFPLYQALVVFDAAGREVARAGSAVVPPRSPAARSGARILWLERGGDQPVLYLEQRVRGGSETTAGGTLVAMGALTTLWHRISTDLGTDRGELHVVTPTARATFAPHMDQPIWNRAPSPGGKPCETSAPVISRYRAENGLEVLGACRTTVLDLVVIQELEAKAALASTRDLRNRVLVIALAGAVLLAGLGYALVVRLIRPIEALIEGANAVSLGDYAHEVKISSHDELGYLVAVFNDMTRALRATHGELEQMTRTDELTGLFNRRHLDAALEGEVERARRENAPLGVLMLDLDHFKAFNDRFGTRRAMHCSGPWPSCSASSCAPRIRSLATAARSSRCCFRIRPGPRPSGSRSACAAACRSCGSGRPRRRSRAAWASRPGRGRRHRGGADRRGRLRPLRGEAAGPRPGRGGPAQAAGDPLRVSAPWRGGSTRCARPRFRP